MSIPDQPSYNAQDDLTIDPAPQANTENSGADAAFGTLQRAYKAGPAVPAYPGDQGTRPGSHGSMGGQSD